MEKLVGRSFGGGLEQVCLSVWKSAARIQLKYIRVSKAVCCVVGGVGRCLSVVVGILISMRAVTGRLMTLMRASSARSILTLAYTVLALVVR